MSDTDDLPGSQTDRIVENGERYTHSEYGRVEISDIWNGIREVDSTRDTTQSDVIIVRYAPVRDGDAIDGFTDTLTEFLEATK